MKLSDHVMSVFDDASRSKWQSALMHACISVDATSKSLYPSMLKIGSRFKKCIREHIWLVEPMMGVGLNLAETKFTNVSSIPGVPQPDFADLIYHVFRCNHTHGQEVPVEYSVTGSEHMFLSTWELGPNVVRMPDRVVWALTSISVFSRVNARSKGVGGSYFLSWGGERYPIAKWWGREEEIRKRAARWSVGPRIELKELQRMIQAAPATGEAAELVLAAPLPSPWPSVHE